MRLDPKRPFRHPSTSPKRRGLYVRDWRGTKVLPKTDRRLAVDLFHPLPDGDPLAPGIWFVWPGWNDATEERLPWRECTRAEKTAFYRENPGAKEAI